MLKIIPNKCALILVGLGGTPVIIFVCDVGEVNRILPDHFIFPEKSKMERLEQRKGGEALNFAPEEKWWHQSHQLWPQCLLRKGKLHLILAPIENSQRSNLTGRAWPCEQIFNSSPLGCTWCKRGAGFLEWKNNHWPKAGAAVLSCCGGETNGENNTSLCEIRIWNDSRDSCSGSHG